MRNVTVNLILHCCAEVFGVTVREMKAMRRRAAPGLARSAACLLARDLTEFSYPQVGRTIGMRDHSTIMSAVRAAERLRGEDAEFSANIEAARALIVDAASRELREDLHDLDATAIAARVCNDPLNAPTRVSVNEIGALAVRLLGLEDAACSAFDLLLHIDDLATTPAGPRADALRDNIAAITETLSSALTSLGYAIPAEEATNQGSLDHVA